MSRLVEFHLGNPGSNLSQRNLVIKYRSSGTQIVNTNLAGSTETYETDLPEGQELQAVLTDRRNGVDAKPTVLNFVTRASTAGGVDDFQSGPLRIISMEDTSSSSSSSTSSLSSSSSSSSSSTSTLSSSSSSSTSTLSSSSSSSTT